MDYYLIAATVPCPRCHVRAWQRCKTKGGNNSPGHVSRYWLALHPEWFTDTGELNHDRVNAAASAGALFGIDHGIAPF